MLSTGYVQCRPGKDLSKSEQNESPIWQKSISTLSLFWTILILSQRSISTALRERSSETAESKKWEYCIKYWRHIKNLIHPTFMPVFTLGLVHQLLDAGSLPNFTYSDAVHLVVFWLKKNPSQCIFSLWICWFNTKVTLKLQGVFWTGPYFSVKH